MNILLRKKTIETEAPPQFPTRIQRGLWRLHFPNTPLVEAINPEHMQMLWYQSHDHHIHPIYKYSADYYSGKEPYILLLGPLLHPQIAIHSKRKWLQQLLANGHDVYIIGHRSHHHEGQSVDDIRNTESSFHSIASDDIQMALWHIENISGFHTFNWIAQDFGSILFLHTLALMDVRQFLSIHLINIPSLPTSILKALAFTVLHQNSNIQTIWNLHLKTGTLPSAFTKLTLEERSVLLHSNSWIMKDWLQDIKQWAQTGAIEFNSGIELWDALPQLLDCPINIYTSIERFNTMSSQVQTRRPLWTVFQHSINECCFPLLAPDFNLQTL